jgi:hypothetical protein
MTIAGVFTFILGAASWKTLEDQRKLAGETLESQKKLFDAELKTLLSSSKNLLDETLQQSSDSLKQTERLRDEVERDFPMFGRIGSNFSKVLTGLAAACSKLKMDDETYKTLSWKEEQRILFYESAMSTSMLLDAESRAKELSEIYRLLGIFYGSKFCSSLPDREFSRSIERDDFYRSQFYFGRAIELDDKNYLAYLSAGYFTQYNDDLSIVEIARGYLESAAVLGPRFQKPVYMIALIELEALGDADTFPSWSNDPVQRDRVEPNLIAPSDQITFIRHFNQMTGQEHLASVKSLGQNDACRFDISPQTESVDKRSPLRFNDTQFHDNPQSIRRNRE